MRAAAIPLPSADRRVMLLPGLILNNDLRGIDSRFEIHERASRSGRLQTRAQLRQGTWTIMDRREILLMAATLAASRATWAQALTRIIIGLPPGGAADTIARQLANNMSFPNGGSAIVESRTGAAGRLGVVAAKAAAPNGLSLLVTPASILTIFPHVYTKVGYDPIKDLSPITTLCDVPYSINIGPLVPESVKTLKDFVAWCKANQDKAFFGIPGEGTTPHFMGWMFGNAAGIQYRQVPYRGGAPALFDVMAGQIASSVNVVSEVLPSAKAGKVRVLAISTAQRLPQAPEVPTFSESGFPGMEAAEWFGLFAPTGTPTAMLEDLNRSAVAAISKPDVQKFFTEAGLNPKTTTTDELRTLLRTDFERWGPIAKSTGFKIDE